MDAYVGTIQPFAFQFAPRGWAHCSGQLMRIQQDTALFSLIGNTYGGDGFTNFALPNLNGRTALSQGTLLGEPFAMGQAMGTETVTLLPAYMPHHTHYLFASTSPATADVPGSGMVLAAATGADPVSGDAVTVHIYSPGSAGTPLSPTSVGATGGNQPFSIMQPYLVVNYCIALQGPFPARN